MDFWHCLAWRGILASLLLMSAKLFSETEAGFAGRDTSLYNQLVFSGTLKEGLRYDAL